MVWILVSFPVTSVKNFVDLLKSTHSTFYTPNILASFFLLKYNKHPKSLRNQE